MHRASRIRHRLGAGGFSAMFLFSLVATAVVAPTAVSATEPDKITIEWGGCRGSATSAQYLVNPDADTQGETPYICADSQYTPGNLGKGWNELDLVPQRLETERSLTSSTGTYDLRITADGEVPGPANGYDFISIPTINTALSDDSCKIVVTDADGSDADTLPDLQGVGTDTIYRNVRITQDPGTTCVIDVDFRLSIGSHLYPGSSLHTHINNENGGTQGVGNKDNSIPVNEILPQAITKTMTASRDSDTAWTLTKHATPAVINFGDTCSPTAVLSAQATITVTWEKVGVTPSGDATIITKIYATNPAHRLITINVTDKIYAGATQATLLDTATSGPVDVAANTADFLVLTHTTTVADASTTFNDVATATYTDKLTGVPVPGTTTASASATVQTGTTTNSSATVTDTESITGALTFKVATPSVGTFTGSPAYVAGTATTGPVAWSSGSVTDDGSVSFSKTISVAAATSTTGVLSDTATLTGSDGFTTSASAKIDVTSSRTSTLTINKTIPGKDNLAHTFTFDVSGTTASITIPAGSTTGSTTVTGLTFGADYVVSETGTDGYAPQTAQNVDDIGCAAAVTFNNTFGPASAQVQKVTVPAGNEAGWVMTLTGPGTPVGGESKTTTGAGYIAFTTVLQEGAYTITETAKPGFDQTDSAGCSFTVDYPADQDKVFSCTLTNTERGHATVTKTYGGTTAAYPAGTSFIFTLRTGASQGVDGTVIETKTITGPATVTFDSLLVPGNYAICEQIPAPPVGWVLSILSDPNVFTGDPLSANPIACVPFTVTAGQTVNFTFNNNPPPGGSALTIGFWKNHADCKASKGKQTAVLNVTLAKAGSFRVGDEVVDTCQEAVNLLNKSDLSGKKQASLPEFNFASQYMAYLLNIAAGSGDTGEAHAAALAGQAILDENGFIGNALPKTGVNALTAAEAAALNTYAGILDNFNNNNP